MATGTNTLNRDILAALDIAAEYVDLGVDFTAREPSASGWLACWAKNRPHGNSPSAGVNVRTGVYKDHGAGGECLGLFDFAAKYGNFADWREARKHFAKKAGLARRLPKKDQEERPEDAFDWLKTWQPALVMGLLKKYPQFTDEALRLCGGRLARFPRTGPDPNYVVAFGCHGPELLDDTPRGFSCLPATSRPISVFAGEGNPPKLLTKMNKGPSGLVGHHGLARLRDADLIFKVEGLSDMVALQAFIPEEHRDRHVVITNSSGASEITLPSEVAPVFAGKDVVIIHDWDRPGQDGSQVWINAIGNGIAGSVRNLILFGDEPMPENHGKDLRDWIAAGHSYTEFLDLIDKTPVVSASPTTAGTGPSATGAPAPTVGTTPHQAILKRVGVLVLGHVQGTNTIVCFSQIRCRVFFIKDVDRLKIEHVLMHMGEHCEALIQASGEPDPARITLNQLKRALATESGTRELTDTNQFGVGIWELSGRLAMVGAGEVAIVNGDITSSKVPELNGKLLDFGGSDPWFNLDHLRDLYQQSESLAWCTNVIAEAMEIFGRWDNWLHDDCPELLAALVCCSWVQTVWDYRPAVCITGGANTGKTMLMEECLAKMFGRQMCIFTSKPTEAGVRQEIGHTARIILIDEFEHDRHRQQILNLFRSSTRGTDILRGTTNQRAQRFHLRHIPWVSAIETGLKSEADRSRYIILDLQAIEKGRPSRLRLPVEEQLRELGNRLMVVAMRHWATAKHLAVCLKGRSFGTVDRRVVESYSVPCAMLAAVMGMQEEAAAELLAKVLGKRRFNEDHQTEEESLIQDILDSEVFLPRGGRMAVGQLLTSRSYDLDDQKTTPAKILERVGIKPIERDDSEPVLGNGSSLAFDRVFFSPVLISRTLLRESRFRELDIGQILGRAKGAEKSRQRMNGQLPRGISLPVETLGLRTGDEVF